MLKELNLLKKELLLHINIKINNLQENQDFLYLLELRKMLDYDLIKTLYKKLLILL